MASLRRHEGYLLLDNSVSGGARVESATITCAHCHAIVVLNPQRTRPRAYCQKCDHYVCDSLRCATACDPLNHVFDRLQNAAARHLGKE
jgi:hypothetical protein